MPLATKDHPNAADLKAYGQGRLSAEEMTAIEGHLADCGSCCEALAKLPDDTLLLRAREAATSGFRARENTVAAPPANPREVPQPLKDHPRYRVLGLLGAGGMGAVYKAEHRKMERMVALKVINPGLVSSPSALDRFEREVKTAARLLHPNIVTAHDAEQAGDLHFLVMEFVEGVSLDRLVAMKGPLSPQLAANFIWQAAQGLKHAHEKGMIHRDIKPQNLMITRGSEGPVIKILDFGLAKFATQSLLGAAEGMESAERPENATRAGSVLGTPDYIAPEQANDAHAADIRADIYSLGCTFYFLLTGEPPFAGGSLTDKLHAHQTCEPKPIRLRRPEVPEALAAVLERMLAKDPADRYARPSDLAKALEPFAQAENVAKQKSAAKAKTPAATLPTPPVAAQVEGAPVALELADLNDVIAGAMPLINQTSAHSSPRKKENVPPLLWAGAAAAVIVLIAGLSWYATSGNDDQKKQRSVTPPIVTLPDNAPVRPAPSPVAIQQKVLMVLPLNHTFFPDYDNVRRALSTRSIQLETAALSKTPQGVGFASEQGGTPPDNRPLVPDKELAEVKAADYDAIIFIGGQAGELCGNEPGAPLVRRLLNDFEQQGKFITALCAGQHVLAEHGKLTAGRRVAGGQFAQMVPGFRNGCQANIAGSGVVTDGQLITGALATDGGEFGRVLAAAILKR